MQVVTIQPLYLNAKHSFIPDFSFLFELLGGVIIFQIG